MAWLSSGRRWSDWNGGGGGGGETGRIWRRLDSGKRKGCPAGKAWKGDRICGGGGGTLRGFKRRCSSRALLKSKEEEAVK